MFDIGWTELVIVGVVALIVIGPRELPGLLRNLGQIMTKLRRMASDFQSQFQDALREAELDDLRKQAEDLSSEMTSAAGNPLQKATSELQSLVDAPETPKKSEKKDASPPPADTGAPAASPNDAAPADAASGDKPATGDGGRAA